MSDKLWAVGVDLGGTKIEAAAVDRSGKILESQRQPTKHDGKPVSIENEIYSAVERLQERMASPPVGIGIGVAGQIDADEGEVIFAPNLEWHQVPIATKMKEMLGLPVKIINDVRAAMWGEWLFGAGKGSNDVICIFVGTGIGGGIVVDGQVLNGCNNSAGEVGHMVVDINGPQCHCGNHGCMEALAGGWAIARDARKAIQEQPEKSKMILELARGEHKSVNAKHVAEAYLKQDQIAVQIFEQVIQALIAGTTNLVNALNPCRVIFGGGVIEGLPCLIDRITTGVHQSALSSAINKLEILPASLHNDAGVIGAAAFMFHHFTDKEI
jgi:glucokinase